MNKGPEVARGKTKILYQHPERADAVIVSSRMGSENVAVHGLCEAIWR